MMLTLSVVIAIIFIVGYFSFFSSEKSSNQSPEEIETEVENRYSSHKKPQESSNSSGSTKKHTSPLIGEPFKFQCDVSIFNEEEYNALFEYGVWLRALTLKNIEPNTKSQEQFLEECDFFKSLTADEMSDYLRVHDKDSIIQYSWLKYLWRIKREKQLDI